MSDSTVFFETNFLLSSVDAKLRKDIEITKDDLERRGYDVFSLSPGQTTLTEVDGILGFYVLTPDNQVKRLVKLLRRYRFDKFDAVFGCESNLMVYLVTLRDEDSKMAILYPVYYHLSQEAVLRKKGPKGFYTHFRVLSGRVVASVNMRDYRIFLRPT